MSGISVRLILVIILGISFNIAFAEITSYNKAGFTCSRAKSDIDKYLCSNKVVSDLQKYISSSTLIAELDSLLNDVYASQLKVSVKSTNLLKKDQKAWIRKRKFCMVLQKNESCMLNAYHSQIRKLGGLRRLVNFYKKQCKADEWKCEIVGDLELNAGRLSAAAKYYSIMCKADRDGDGGGNCYKQASVLEKQKKITEAKALYANTCRKRKHNEACWAAQKLDAKPVVSGQWYGLYRNQYGSVFIARKGKGGFTLNMTTNWANGHSCSFSAKGIIKNNKATIESHSVPSKCGPVIIKKGKVISIKDPTGQCRYGSCGLRGVFEGDFVKVIQ